MTKRKTQEEFLEEIKALFNDEYTVLGQYKNWKTKILVRHNCKRCKNYEWEIAPTNFLKGNGCPVCSTPPQKIVLGINTIWDTDKWMCSLGLSEKDAKKNTCGSGKRVNVICPDCGKSKNMVIKEIYTRKTISCSCGDGKSYPEKFIMSMLEQLGITFETEYSPSWANKKRYDFYIEKYNCIIEANGSQHYKRKFNINGNRSLEDEKINDEVKKQLALKWGIKYYVIIDCSESNLKWIKNSIEQSILKDLFDLNKINWNECSKYATKNIVKKVCDYWNEKFEFETTVNVGEHFNLSRGTIVEYLKKGTKLNWCNYSGKEELKKSAIKSNKLCRKKVEVFKDEKSLGVFNSISELSNVSENLFGIYLSESKISLVCNNKKPQYKGFNFKFYK